MAAFRFHPLKTTGAETDHNCHLVGCFPLLKKKKNLQQSPNHVSPLNPSLLAFVYSNLGLALLVYLRALPSWNGQPTLP